MQPRIKMQWNDVEDCGHGYGVTVMRAARRRLQGGLEDLGNAIHCGPLKLRHKLGSPCVR